MFDRNSTKNKRKPEDEFVGLERTFVRDPTTNISLPETEAEKYDSYSLKFPVNKHPRFPVDVRTDWIPIILSLAVGIATIAIVAQYTYYAAIQAGESSHAANAASQASYTAALALKDSKESFDRTFGQMKAQTAASQRSSDALIGANRAWMVPTSFTQQVATTVTFNNAGKSPAVNLVGKVEYDTQIVLERNVDDMKKASPLKDGCTNLEHIQPKFMQSMVAEGKDMEVQLGSLPNRWTTPIAASYGFKRLIIHGCLWYQDTLTNQQRWTEFWLQALNSKMRGENYDKDAAIVTVDVHNGKIFVFH